MGGSGSGNSRETKTTARWPTCVLKNRIVIDARHARDAADFLFQRVGHQDRLARRVVGERRAEKEIALQGLAIPGADVAHGRRNDRSQADADRHGHVDDADGQCGAERTADDLPLRKPNLRQPSGRSNPPTRATSGRTSAGTMSTKRATASAAQHDRKPPTAANRGRSPRAGPRRPSTGRAGDRHPPRHVGTFLGDGRLHRLQGRDPRCQPGRHGGGQKGKRRTRDHRQQQKGSGEKTTGGGASTYSRVTATISG